MKTKILIGGTTMAAVTGLVLLSGCSTATSSPDSGSGGNSPSTNVNAGSPADNYLAIGPSIVQFIQWDPSTGSGTYTSDQLTGSPPDESVNSNQQQITVTVNGASVIVSGLQQPNGTLTGGTLSIQVLQSDGTLGTETFTTATASQYNSAVAALHSQAQQANANAQAQQEQQAQQAANTKAEQHAQADLASVTQGGGFGSDLSQLTKDVAQTNSDLAAEKTAAAAGPNADGGDCYNLTANVSYDAENDVEYDAQNDLGYDLQNNLEPDISNERSNIQNLENDITSLKNSGLTVPVGASGAITAAQRAISQAVGQANADTTQVNSDVTEAYAIADGMATGSCSGDGPGNLPTPVQPIS